MTSLPLNLNIKKISENVSFYLKLFEIFISFILFKVFISFIV